MPKKVKRKVTPSERVRLAAGRASVHFHEYYNHYFTIAFKKGVKWERRRARMERTK